jgi:mannose-6-phosphate isomerase-like protein (cupin superfamily)
MEGYYDNLDVATLTNIHTHYEVYRDDSIKIDLISLNPKDEIGLESHKGTTQFIKVVKGVGLAIIGDKTLVINAGMALIIPADVEHNIINVSATDDLKMYTTYTGNPIDKEVLKRKIKVKMEDVWKDTLEEMRGEIAFQGEVKDFIAMCQTNKAHLARCMLPGPWVDYMKDRPIDDVYLIITFASQYYDEHPDLFWGVANAFIRNFKSEIKDVTKLKETLSGKPQRR